MAEKTREELLEVFDAVYGFNVLNPRPHWVEILTKAGIQWHIDQQRQAIEAAEADDTPPPPSVLP